MNMKLSLTTLALCMASVGFTSAPTLAEPTEITIHVLSKGAKFIGTSMGGVAVQIVDVESGDVLAEGLTNGSTGDTEQIMRTAHTRNGTLSTEAAAKFVAMLDIDAPRLVRLEARGPINPDHAAATVTATQWIVPGKHMSSGDGWMIEMPGLAVVALSPLTDTNVSPNAEITLNAKVTMMCGCPLTPGGLWDADEFQVVAIIMREGEKVDQLTLKYAGEASHFTTTYRPSQAGTYEAIVFAHQPSNGNTGLDRTNFFISE